jgi:hypothetical protein
MEPELTLFMSDGTTQVARATRSESESANGYLYIIVPIDQLDPMNTMMARVRDIDSSATGGVYNISAGEAIFSDMTVAEKDLLFATEEAGDDSESKAIVGLKPHSSGGCSLTSSAPIQSNLFLMFGFYSLIWIRRRFK